MELKSKPLIGLELTVRKVVIITTAFAILITSAIFLYTSLSSSSDSLAGTGSGDEQICFTISDYENKIYKFRLSDGTILDSKSLSSLSSPEASTLNLDGDTLWILNQDELHYVLTSTSSLANTRVSGSNISGQSLTGSLGSRTISDFDAMSVDVNGNIWAGTSSNDPCLLVVIDASTGNVKEDFFGTNKDYLVVNNSAWSALRFDAMAFDPLNNELYANMNGTSQNYDYLFKINTTTGNMELIRQFNTINDVEGMGFDAVGDLYVTTGSNASSSSITNTLWKVDLINGEVTKSFNLWGGDMESCDCVFGDPISTVEVSGYVFYDENKDTTFDGGDYGKNSFLVSLYKDVNGNGAYDSGTDVFVDTTRTYADGFYNFRLNYTTGTDKYVLVSNANDLPTDNDYTTDNIEVASFTAGRQKDENNNFGFVVDSTNYINIISGTVYADVNENANLESFENGVSGVKVILYADDDCNGVVDTGEQELESTIVGADGKYSFIRTYSPSTTSTSTTSISKTISSSYDDASESSDGDMNRTDNDFHFGDRTAGLRFRSLAIPQGATITSAYITVTAEGDKTESTEVKIYGEDVNDASAFSSSDDDITDRTKTSNSSTWNPGSWTKYDEYNTSDLSTIVEEIVGRTNWSTGNDMVFILKKINGHRDAYTYDGSSSKAPVLVVVYQTTTTTSSSTVCYTTKIDESTKPSGSHLTTDNIETAVFTTGGNHDSLNDFGLWGGALPVEWLSFKARYIGDAVQLDWATGSEDNNSHFVVERTHDGAHWETLGEVIGAGFSVEINRYQFIDENPYGDINYYRIKQVDFDGEFDYSKVEIISSLIERASYNIELYPNPARSYVVVGWNDGSKNGKVQVVDLSGKLVLEQNAGNSNSIRIDLTNFDTGIYFVKYNNGRENMVKRLVVKH